MRYILFSWNNPKLIENINCFLDYLPENNDSLVVTTGIDGIMNFLVSGHTAIGLSQIKTTKTEIKYVLENFSTKQLNSVSEFDQKIGKKGIPQEKLPNISDDYYLNLSVYYLSKFLQLTKSVNPEIIFVWNGMNPAQKSLSVLAEHLKIPCYYMERGLLPNTLCIDETGVNFASHIAGKRWRPEKIDPPTTQEIELLNHEFKNLGINQETIVKTGKNVSKEELYKQLCIPKSSKIILLALQIERDSNIVFYSPHYKNMTDIVKDTANAIKNIKNTFLIIKPHPENLSDKMDFITFNRKNSTVSSDISLYSLIDTSNVVVCVNSTVGLEALTQKKQVVVLGNAIYSQKNFTKDLNEKTDLTNLINQALSDDENKKFNHSEFNRFITYLKRYCLFGLKEEDPWDSRKNIVNHIKNSMKKNELKINITRNKTLEKTVANNQNIIKRLNRKTSILVHSKKSFEFLQKDGHNVTFAKNRVALFLNLLLLGKYDIVIVDGFMGKKLKLMKRFFTKTIFLTQSPKE